MGCGRVIYAVKSGGNLYGVVIDKAIHRVHIDLETGRSLCTCSEGGGCCHAQLLAQRYGQGLYIELSGREAALSLISPAALLRSGNKGLSQLLDFYTYYIRVVGGWPYTSRSRIRIAEASSVAYALSLLLKTLNTSPPAAQLVELLTTSLHLYRSPHYPRMALAAAENYWSLLVKHVKPEELGEEDAEAIHQSWLQLHRAGSPVADPQSLSFLRKIPHTGCWERDSYVALIRKAISGELSEHEREDLLVNLTLCAAKGLWEPVYLAAAALDGESLREAIRVVARLDEEIAASLLSDSVFLGVVESVPGVRAAETIQAHVMALRRLVRRLRETRRVDGRVLRRAVKAPLYRWFFYARWLGERERRMLVERVSTLLPDLAMLVGE